MLTNFPECRAHLTGGGKTHPPPLDTLGFQHGIHFTCMAIDRQWSRLIFQLLRFDLKFVNAVTYVIITNIFHGYVYMLTFLAAISLSVSLLYFPSRFQLPTNWLLYSNFEIFAHETHKLVHNKYIYRYILHLECVAGRHCKIWIYIEVLVFLYTHYIIKSFYDISNPLRLIITRKLIRTFTLGLILCFLKQTNEQSGELKVYIIWMKTCLKSELKTICFVIIYIFILCGIKLIVHSKT